MVRSAALYLLCLYCAVLGAAETEWDFPAGVPPHVIIRAQLKVINFGEMIQSWDPPSINNVEFLGIQSGGHFTQIRNGVKTEEQTLFLSMRFKKTGTYTIPAITFSARSGKSIKTKAHKITVVDNQFEASGDCFARASISAKQVVPGQQFTLTYQVGLRTNKRLSIKQQLGLELPEDAIRKGDLRADDPKIAYDKQGNTWQVTNYYIDLTLPKSGTYTFGGQQSYGVNQERIFNSFYRELGKVSVQAVSIVVKDLPSEGQPAHFTGLVGPVTLQAKLDKDRIALGKNVILEITASDGQVDMLGSISVPTIDGLNIYQGERESDDTGQSVTHYFTLVPKREGTFSIPAIEVPFFDPETERYRAVSTSPLSLTVIPGKERDLGLVGSTNVQIPNSSAETALGSGMLLPAPYFGQAPSSTPHQRIWWSLALSFLIGTCVLFGSKVLKHDKNPVLEQLQAFKQAIASDQLEAANRIIHQLMHNLPASEHSNAEAFIQAIEQARFGQSALAAAIKQQIQDWQPKC